MGNPIIARLVDKSIDGKTTLNTARRNSFKRYPFSDNDTKSGGYRLVQNGPVDVNIAPKFLLNTSDRIFTMGSCFARNIERSLGSKNVEIVNERIRLPDRIIARSHRAFVKLAKTHSEKQIMNLVAASAVNKYNVSSMLDELGRIQKGESSYLDTTSVVKISEQYYDPLIKNVLLKNKKDVLDERECLAQYFLSLKKANVFIFTLGLTEVWIDTKADIICNVTPPGALIKGQESRYRFARLDYLSCYETLKNIVIKTTQLIGDDCRIILTVSPVPLNTTFSTDDVLVANLFSKSILRAASQEVSMLFDNVDYFPSYEIVTLSSRDTAYMQDQIHVSDEMIEHITGLFCQRYFPNPHPG